MSYVSGYAAALKYANAQLKYRDQKTIFFNVSLITDKIEKAIQRTYKVTKNFIVFLYTGYAMSVAVEGALKVNECFLRDAESYELKHYSHGKHFVSHGHERLFNILYQPQDRDLVAIYQGTIFEPKHILNYMESDLPGELGVFEWSVQMLSFIVQSMKYNNVELADIPIPSRVIAPHNFIY
jgi:hypothetical protein